MKIRSDYVSNSSSSSFMIVGEVFSEDKIYDIGKKLGFVTDDDSGDTWDIVEKIAEKFGEKKKGRTFAIPNESAGFGHQLRGWFF